MSVSFKLNFGLNAEETNESMLWLMLLKTDIVSYWVFFQSSKVDGTMV